MLNVIGQKSSSNRNCSHDVTESSSLLGKVRLEDQSDTSQLSIAIPLGHKDLQKELSDGARDNYTNESSSEEVTKGGKSDGSSLPSFLIGSKNKIDSTSARQSVNVHEETIERIINYLKIYEPRDSLDEDEMIDLLDKMNRNQAQRRFQKRNRVALSSDEDQSEDDLKKKNLINVVKSHASEKYRESFMDVDIFNEVVSGISNESKNDFKGRLPLRNLPSIVLHDVENDKEFTKNPSDSMMPLCTKTLNEIKTCLGIEVTVNKPKRKRRGRPPLVKNVCVSPSRKDEILRNTRRMTRGTRIKLREEHLDQNNQDIDILISAMFELEKSEDVSEVIRSLPKDKLRSKKPLSKSKKLRESIKSQNQSNQSYSKNFVKKQVKVRTARNGISRSNKNRDQSGRDNHITGELFSLNHFTRKSIQNYGEFNDDQDMKLQSKKITMLSTNPMYKSNSSTFDSRQAPKSSPENARNKSLLLAKIVVKRKRKTKDELKKSYEVCGTKIVNVKTVVVNGRKFRGSYNKSTKRKILSSPDKDSRKNVKVTKKCLSNEEDLTTVLIGNKEKYDSTSDCLILPEVVSSTNSDDFMKQENKASLGLLDWRRRQQRVVQTNVETETWASNSNLFKKSLSKLNIIPPGAGIGLPHWEEVSCIDFEKHSSTFQIRRRRYCDTIYSSCCSKLINYLQGSGRSMARYEFFYSDIDRAWFNLNPFRVDLAILGISPNTKLTRSEWSLIRRHIKTRPRRFSRHFIKSQMEKLLIYRGKVREIQDELSNSNHSEFLYEVPAFIKVGATVTAFNKKAKILHRGIVLTHEKKTNSYLVQFERNELGCEFCPDIEVASHGVPEIIKPGSNISLDGSYLGIDCHPHTKPGTSLYGTTYGPLLDGYSKENEKRPQNDFINCHSIDGDALKFQPPTKTSNTEVNKQYDTSNHKGTNNISLMKKVAERESLVKLLGALDMMTLRKQMLLDVIERFHSIIIEFMNASGCCAKNFLMHDSNKTFTQYYSWLMANLYLNEECLEFTTSYLQIMYGKLYTGRSKFFDELNQTSDFLPANDEVYKRDPIALNENLSGSWIKVIGSNSEQISKMLCSHFLLGKRNYKDVLSRVEHQDFNSKRIFAVAKVLVTCALTETFVERLLRKYDVKELNEVLPFSSNAFKRALKSLIEEFRPKLSQKNKSLQMTNVEIHQYNAYKSLSDAANWLHAEYVEFLKQFQYK